MQKVADDGNEQDNEKDSENQERNQLQIGVKYDSHSVEKKTIVISRTSESKTLIWNNKHH